MADVLGTGGSGPWEDRSEIIRRHQPNPAAVGGWLNMTYHVQLFQHPTHPGIDHLCIGRHNKAPGPFPWRDLQTIKDTLLADGHSRWAYEAFPPSGDVIDNHNLRHVWVMPVGWKPPIDMADVRV